MWNYRESFTRVTAPNGTVTIPMKIFIWRIRMLLTLHALTRIEHSAPISRALPGIKEFPTSHHINRQSHDAREPLSKGRYADSIISPDAGKELTLVRMGPYPPTRMPFLKAATEPERRMFLQENE